MLKWHGLNCLLFSQLQIVLCPMSSFWLHFFLFVIFPSPSFLTSRPTSSAYHFLESTLQGFPNTSLRQSQSIYLILSHLSLFMRESGFRLKMVLCWRLGSMSPFWGSMGPTFLYLPQLWYPLRMFESLTLAFTGKWEVEIYKYFTLFISTYSPNPKYVLYNVNHWLAIEFSSIFCTLYIYDMVKLITGIGICWPNTLCF